MVSIHSEKLDYLNRRGDYFMFADYNGVLFGKYLGLLLQIFLISIIPAVGQSNETDLYEIKIKKVKDNVYIAYREEPLRPYVEGNVTIIINESDVVLVDAGSAPPAARKVISEIKKLTNNPVRYIINTHIHRDHRFGTQEYQKTFPRLEIICHPEMRNVIAGSGQTFVTDTAKRLENSRKSGEEEIKRLREENKPGNDKVIAYLERYYNRDIFMILREYPQIINVVPTITFEEKFTLYRGQRRIEAMFLGRGDTTHDVVVFLPDDKIVITGDMVVHPVPYGFSKTPFEWLQTLGKLSQLDFDTLIPGHGEVQTGKTYLEKLMSLLQSIQQQVRAGIEAGLDFENVKKQVDISKFEREFAGDDPIKRYFFKEYFVIPAVKETFDSIKTKREVK